MNDTIMYNLRQHLTRVIADDGAAWQVEHGWRTGNHSVSVSRRGVVSVRRFAGRTQEYHADMRLGDLDAMMTELAQPQTNIAPPPDPHVRFPFLGVFAGCALLGFALTTVGGAMLAGVLL
jgi:hypothetical protein